MRIETTMLARALKSVLFAASTDAERPSISAVQIWTEGDKVNLGATDGHWALWWQDVIDADMPSEKASIPLADAKLLLHALTAENARETGATHVDVQLSTPIEVECDRFVLRLDRAPLPPELTEIWRTRTNGTVPWVGVNTEFVAAAGKAFRTAAGLSTAATVSLSFGDTELDPIFVSCERCEQLTAIIMPARTTPTEVREEVVGDERRWIRKDTGEVVRVSTVSKQVAIPGTSDPVVDLRDELQALADSVGGAISVTLGGQTVVLTETPRKAKKQAAKPEPEPEGETIEQSEDGQKLLRCADREGKTVDELATESGLAKAAVKGMCALFVERGLFLQGTRATGKAGKPPTTCALTDAGEAAIAEGF